MAVLAALVSTGPFATNAYMPALPDVRTAFEATLAQAQVTVSFPMLVFAFALVVCGPATDRLGRRPVLLAGLGCFIVGSAIAFAATSLMLLAVGRAIQLIGGATGLIVSRAIVSDTYVGARATRVITALGLVSLVGHALAPLITGYVVLHSGWRPIFAGLWAVGVLLGVIAWRTLPESRPQIKAQDESSARSGGLKGLLSAPFIGGTLAIALLYACFSAFAALAPHIMVHAYGGDAAQYGRYYVVVPAGFIVGGLLLLLKLKESATDRVIAAGLVVVTLAPAIGVLLAMRGVLHPLALFLPMGCVCFGHALVVPNLSVKTVARVAERVGTGWGVLTFTQHFAAAAAVQLTGGLRTNSPVPILGLCFIAGALAAFLRWTTRPSDNIAQAVPPAAR
jgi:DHA1 family bicyclomycin/chloramphenicol resistance-like MFS transporter